MDIAWHRTKTKTNQQNRTLSEIHQKALAKLEKMNDKQVEAVINSLNEIEMLFTSRNNQA